MYVKALFFLGEVAKLSITPMFSVADRLRVHIPSILSSRIILISFLWAVDHYLCTEPR